MGRKLTAAKTSLVAAFLAANGAAAAQATPAQSAKPANTVGGASAINWGDQLIRFLKLDGFPAYLKIDGFAALAQYYKMQIVADVSTLYLKYGDQVAGLLELYQKADAGPLAGILIGLEQYYKEDNIAPLVDYLKTPGAMDAYLKFESFFSALRAVGGERQTSAFQFFYKETGIAGNPLARVDVSGIG